MKLVVECRMIISVDDAEVKAKGWGSPQGYITTMLGSMIKNNGSSLVAEHVTAGMARKDKLPYRCEHLEEYCDQ